MKKAEAVNFIKALVHLRGAATDEQAIDAQAVYPEWKPECTYAVNDRVLYSKVLYKVLQEHTSQESWTPDAAVSLFTKVLIPDEQLVYNWAQPDSTNPYMLGDKVMHNGQT